MSGQPARVCASDDTSGGITIADSIPSREVLSTEATDILRIIPAGDRARCIAVANDVWEAARLMPSAETAEIVRVITAGYRAGGIAIGNTSGVLSAETAEKKRIRPTDYRAGGKAIIDNISASSAETAESAGARSFFVLSVFCRMPASARSAVSGGGLLTWGTP